MDGRHQSSEVPQGRAQQHQKQQPQQEQQQIQQGKQPQFHGQHQRRHRPHYEQRVQQHQNRVQQLRCRSHIFRQHQEGKRGSNEAGLQLTCVGTTMPILRRQRSLADKAPDAAAPQARNRLLARSRSTPWSLDEKHQSKVVPRIGEIVPHHERLIRAASPEAAAASGERNRIGFPATQRLGRLRRLPSYGSVDTSNRSSHTGSVQTTTSGVNHRYIRCSSQSIHRGGWAGGGNQNGNSCPNNNITTNDYSNTCGSYTAFKGSQARLRAFVKKSVSFHCSSDLDSKYGVFNSRKDCGYVGPYCQQSVVQLEYDPKQAEQQRQAAEGCDWTIAKEVWCSCASEVRHLHPNRAHGDVETAHDAYNDEASPVCFKLQTQQQQRHQRQKYVSRRKLQEQKVLQRQQQAPPQPQQHSEQQIVERRETACSPERASANNLPSELVGTQQALLQEQPRLGKDRSSQDSPRSAREMVHSATQQLRPFALHDRQNQKPHQNQNHQQQTRPQQHETQDIQPVPHRKTGCLSRTYYSLQWPPPHSVLYCQQMQQLQAGSSSYYKKEMTPCPDPLLQSLLLGVPDKLCVSPQQTSSGSARPPCLQLRLSAAQRSFGQDTCKTVEKHVCIRGQNESSGSRVSAPQGAISPPSASSPRPAGEDEGCRSEIGKDEKQGLSNRVSCSSPARPPLTAPSNPPACTIAAAAAVSCRSYLATHATRIDKHSVDALANDEGYLVPATHASNGDWTTAMGSLAQRRDYVSHLPEAPRPQNMRHLVTGAICLKQAGNTAESGSNTVCRKNATAAAYHAGESEPSLQAAAADSSTGDAPSDLTGATTTSAVSGTTNAACISSAEETDDRKPTPAISAAPLPQASCSAGCPPGAVAPVQSSSTATQPEHAVTYEGEHVECSQWCSSCSELGLPGHPAQCTAPGNPVPSRFLLAFPPKDKSLLLPLGAPLVAASCGTTNGGVDNKDHDYIARQYEFIFPDHLLAVTGPLSTSAYFAHPIRATGPLSTPAGVAILDPATSAPTTAPVATAATGSSGCDPPEPVAHAAAAGVLVKPVTQLDHQSTLCPTPAARPIINGGVCKANANACVLSTVHAAGELPCRPLLQREELNDNGSTVDRLKKPETASCISGPSFYVTSPPKTGRAAETSGKAVNSKHRGMLQGATLEYEEDREGRGSPSTERESRQKRMQEKDLLDEDGHMRSSRSAGETDVKDEVVELPVKGERDAAGGEHTKDHDRLEQQGMPGTIVCSRKGVVESRKSSTRSQFDVKGGTLVHQAVDGRQHEGANDCARLYDARKEVRVEGPGKMEKKTKADQRQSNGNAGAEAAAVLHELQEKQRVLRKCAAGPEAVHSQRRVAATTALQLQGRAKSLPAQTFSFFKYRHRGARALPWNSSGRLAGISRANAQGAQVKGEFCAGQATAGSMFGKTAQTCACLSVHANQQGHDTQQDNMQATKQHNWYFAHDIGPELTLPKTSPTGSVVPAAGEEIGEKASEIDVEDAGVQNACSKCVLRQRPHRIQRMNSTSGQEAYGCELYDVPAGSCVPCSSPNSSPHSGSNSCENITGSGFSRGRHRLHYYQVLRLLGRGTFGHVYECLQYDAYSGEAVAAVAVKIVKNDEAYTRSAMQETAILRQLNGKSCNYSCNCRTLSAAPGMGGRNTSSSSCIGAASGKVGTVSGGGGVERRDGNSVHSDQEPQWEQYQSGAGQQPQQPDRQQQDSVQDKEQQAYADLGKLRLVQLLDDFTHCGHKCLVFELLQTDLYQLLKKYRFSGFPLGAVKQVCRELLQGLAHLKRVGVVHCDLKPENILVRFSGFLPAQQQHPNTQWRQGALQQQHDSVQHQLPLQQHQPPLLQSAQQQELQFPEQRQRRCSRREVSAAEETRQQQELAAVNISQDVPPVSSTLQPASTTPVSTSASASAEDLPTEDQIIEREGVCCGSSGSLTEKAASAAVDTAGPASSNAIAGTTAPDVPLPLEACSLPSAPIRSLLTPVYRNPSPKEGKRLPSLPVLHAIKHSAACNAEACLPLPERRTDRSLTCSTKLTCSTSLGCIPPVFWQQPVTTHTAAHSQISSACPVPAVDSSSYNAGNMFTAKCIRPMACAKTNTVAESPTGACAVAPPPTATTIALPPGTRERTPTAAGSVSTTAVAPDVYATAATSSAAHLHISVKLVDFSSAYPLPSCPQPADPAAIEVLEQEHAPRPAAPYLYAQSRFYGAPEMMLGVRYMNKLDVWAVGCVAAELYSGKPLLPGATDYDQMRRLVALRGTPPEWMLRIGRRTSLYFARDRLQQQQPLAEDVEEDERRRLQHKDEEGKWQEKPQTRRQHDHEEKYLEVQEEQQQQLNRKRRQRQNQQQVDDDVLVHQAGEDSYKGMEDERAEKIVGQEENLKQQEPSMCETNLHGEAPVADGAPQVSLLNSSLGAAGETVAPKAFVRGERLGALTAAPCGLPRRQIQAWWRRILIAVSSRSTVEKKPHQDKYCRRPSIPQHQLQQTAESAHQQQQRPTGVAEQQADVAPIIQGPHQQQPEKCCGATAARTNQQQQEIQHAATLRQRGESCILSTVREADPQTYVPLVSEHSAEGVKQRSAAQACAENLERPSGSASHVNPVKKGRREEGRRPAVCREEKGDRRSGSTTRSVHAAGRCKQGVPGKAGLKSEAISKHVPADSNRAANSLGEALGETNATSTCNEAPKQCTEGNTDATTGGCCCSAEGSGWRLKTAQEVGEGTSSREQTPRGGPVLRSLQELLTMRKRREQLCKLQMEQHRTILTNDGGPRGQVYIPGSCWPMTDEGFPCKRPAAYPLELEVATCVFHPHTSEEANMQSVSPVETAASSYAVSNACVKSAEEACGQLCMSSRNWPSQCHTGSSVPWKEAPASEDARLLSSCCLDSAHLGTATRLESFPQSSRSKAAPLLSHAANSGCTQALRLRSDSKADGVLNSALQSGARKPQGESLRTLGSGEEAGRTEAATAAARENSLENSSSTSSARGCFLRRSELQQALSEKLEKTKTVQLQKFRVINEEERRFPCPLVQAFPHVEQSALTGTASSVLQNGFSGDSAGAPCSAAAPFNSAVPQAPAKEGCAAVASALSPSCPQRDPTPPHDATESPHQPPAAPVAKTTPPQAAGSMRHHFPTRASRFFKKLMKGRASRQSSSNYSVVYSESHFAASPSQNTSTDKPECSATPGKRLPRYSASPPSTLPAVSTVSLPPCAPPVPELGLHRPALSSPHSARVTPNPAATQQKIGVEDDTVAGASSHLPPLSGAAAFFAPPAATTPSATSRVSSYKASESSSLRSSACVQISSAVSAAGRLHPLQKSGSAPCSDPRAVCFPGEPTNAASHSCSAVSAACSSSNSAAPCPVLPVDRSSSAGVCTPTAPVDDTVVVLPTASGSPALAASTLPLRVAASLPNFATASAPAVSSRQVNSVSCVPAPAGAAVCPALRSFCSCSPVVGVASSSSPLFPLNGGELRKDNSILSTASSSTVCTYCSLQYTDAAAVEPTKVADAQVEAEEGTVLQKQPENEKSEEAAAPQASPLAPTAAAPEEQAEEERQEQLFLDFLDGMLQVDPFKRFTVEEAVRHPFVAEDFSVVPPVATYSPATAAALSAATAARATTAATHPAGTTLPAAEAAPQPTTAFPSATEEVKAEPARCAPARAAAPELQQERNVAVQEEEHRSPTVSGLAVVHSSNVAAACTSPDPAAPDPQMAAATAGVGLALLRERAVHEQYRIWSSGHFREVVERLRENAVRHQQATAAAQQQGGATEERAAMTSNYAGRKQQQGSPQQQTVRAGHGQREEAHEVVHVKTKGKR